MSVLVIDVGTSSLRAAIVQPDATVAHVHQQRLPPSTPFPGLVEFDAAEMAAAVLAAARATLAEGGPVDAVGITNQRASTVLWDRGTGAPVAPAIGWQDLRTVFDCLTLAGEHGIRLAPNQSATKLATLLDAHDPDRVRDLCFGTVDTWLAWTLSEGRLHVTDPSNAAVTGLLDHLDAAVVGPRARDPAHPPLAASRPSSTPADPSARRPRSTARRRSPRSSATSRARSSGRAACAPA